MQRFGRGTNIYGSSAAMLSGLTQNINKKLMFIILINDGPILTSTLAAGIVPGCVCLRSWRREEETTGATSTDHAGNSSIS